MPAPEGGGQELPPPLCWQRDGCDPGSCRAVATGDDPNLKNTDTFNDGETSIAVNPRDPDDITISAFSGGWGATAPLWRSTDNGRTWTKLFTIPFPPGVAGTLGCPCDQTFDYGKNNALFGTFLTVSPTIFIAGPP
jgi:hypothetical protein